MSFPWAAAPFPHATIEGGSLLHLALSPVCPVNAQWRSAEKTQQWVQVPLLLWIPGFYPLLLGHIQPLASR